MPNPIFEMSVDTRLLKQRLATVAIGEIITYADLSAVISRPVNGSTSALASARQSLFKSDRILFSPVPKVGLKRLSDVDKVSAADAEIRKIRRAARRGADRLASVENYSALPPDKQLAHTAKMAAMTAAAYVTTDTRVNALGSTVASGTKELPIAATLAAMMPSK